MKFPFNRKYLLLSAFLPLLAGCVNESASYPFGPEQALTLIREQPYFWSNEIRRTMVVMNLPQCLVRYRLPIDMGKAGSVKVFKAEEGGFVMQDGMGQYRATVADCGMSLESKGSSAPGEPVGTFEAVPNGEMRFAPVPGTKK